MSELIDVKVLITTGDPKGVGQEVTFKSLKEISPARNKNFIVFCPQNSKIPKTLGKFSTIKLASLKEAMNKTVEKNKILVVVSQKPHWKWVEECSQYLLTHPRQGCLVNAPMSKLSDGSGHTEILKRQTKTSHVQMCFYGKKFNVVLGTTHISIDKVSKALSKKVVLKSLAAARRMHELTQSSGQLQILGLNPHSGENGAISKFDSKILQWTGYHKLEVPDAAFIKPRRGNTFLCWYHDQGLIPFKMAHGFSQGIQVTLGLPFIRTSVDHGTAKDIFGKNRANHKSMKLAIEMAVKWARNYKGEKL